MSGQQITGEVYSMKTKLLTMMPCSLKLKKHKYVFRVKVYKGNDIVGHKEDEYIFICKECGKVKKVNVVE